MLKALGAALLSQKTKRRAISQPVKLMLYSRAKGLCAFTDCRKDVVIDATPNDPAKQIGIIAHIVAHSDSGPRADPNYPVDSRDEYENLILLCPNCHDTVDGQPETYTVDKLRKIKAEHEAWINSRLATEMLGVDFSELDIIIKAIISNPYLPTEDFTVTAPREKIAKNRLTSQVGQWITMGMARSREVSKYLQNMSTLDPDFSERLKSGFLTAYQRFREQTLDDDALFEAMREFASGGSTEFKRQAAGLIVLVYLFDSCEVFEK